MSPYFAHFSISLRYCWYSPFGIMEVHCTCKTQWLSVGTNKNCRIWLNSKYSNTATMGSTCFRIQAYRWKWDGKLHLWSIWDRSSMIYLSSQGGLTSRAFTRPSISYQLYWHPELEVFQTSYRSNCLLASNVKGPSRKKPGLFSLFSISHMTKFEMQMG